VRVSRGNFYLEIRRQYLRNCPKLRIAFGEYAPHGAAKEHGVITSFDVLAVATPNLMEVVSCVWAQMGARSERLKLQY
jgi:hypothetical protein